MSEQLMYELFARLDALAAKLGVAGEQIWRIMVQGTFRDGLINLGEGVLLGGLGLVLVAIAIGRFLALSKEPYTATTSVMEGIAFVCGFVGALLLLGGFVSLIQGLPQVLNPEYEALYKLLKLLRG